MAGPVEVLVIGYGAVGGLYAYVLEKAGARVTAVARSSYDVLTKHGLDIKSAKFGQTKAYKPYRLVRDASEAADRSYDFIVCTTKCLPDIQPMPNVLAPFIVELDGNKPSSNSRFPTLVLIQNGVGIEQPLAEAFPSAHIISCALWIGTNLLMPGSSSAVEVPTIEHGALEKIVMGLYQGEGIAPQFRDGAPTHEEPPVNYFCEGLLDDEGQPLSNTARTERLQSGRAEVDRFAKLLQAGGSQAVVTPEIQAQRWAKNLWNASWGPLSCLTRAPTSAVVAVEVLPYTLPVVRRAMIEVIYVARALGYNEDTLPLSAVDEAVDLSVDNFQRKPANPSSPLLSSGGGQAPDVKSDFKPSMLLDLEKGAPMELEPIIGAVLDRARLCNVETSRLDLCYAALKVQQEIAAHRFSASDAGQAAQRHLHEWASRKPAVGGSGGAGREAWLREVRRRAKLGQELNESAAGTPNVAIPQPAGGKVTGRPLNHS